MHPPGVGSCRNMSQVMGNSKMAVAAYTGEVVETSAAEADRGKDSSFHPWHGTNTSGSIVACY